MALAVNGQGSLFPKASAPFPRLDRGPGGEVMSPTGSNVARSTQKAREIARRLKQIIVEEQLRSRYNQNRKINSFVESHYQVLEALKPAPHFRQGSKNRKFVQVPVPTGIAMSSNQVESVGRPLTKGRLHDISPLNPVRRARNVKVADGSCLTICKQAI